MRADTRRTISQTRGAASVDVGVVMVAWGGVEDGPRTSGSSSIESKLLVSSPLKYNGSELSILSKSWRITSMSRFNLSRLLPSTNHDMVVEVITDFRIPPNRS